MAVTREPIEPGSFRARRLLARDMLRGDLEGLELEQYVEQSMLHDDARQGGRLGTRRTRSSR